MEIKELVELFTLKDVGKYYEENDFHLTEEELFDSMNKLISSKFPDHEKDPKSIWLQSLVVILTMNENEEEEKENMKNPFLKELQEKIMPYKDDGFKFYDDYHNLMMLSRYIGAYVLVKNFLVTRVNLINDQINIEAYNQKDISQIINAGWSFINYSDLYLDSLFIRTYQFLFNLIYSITLTQG